MEKLQADFQRFEEELKNLKSITTSLVNILQTQQDARPRLHTTQQATGRPQARVSLARSLLDAYSRLEEFGRTIKNALTTANQSPSADTPAHDTSSVANPPPTSNASSSAPSTADTSSSADAPPACDTPPGAQPPIMGDASPRADSPSSDDAPLARETTPGANSPLTDDTFPGTDYLSGCDTLSSAGTSLISDSSPSADSPFTSNTSPTADSPSADSAPISNISRTQLSPASRPAQRSGGCLGDENGCADSPPSHRLHALLDVPPDAPLDAPPDAPLDAPPDAPSYDAPKPIFTLGLSNLGERLIPKLQTLIEDNNFTGKLLVEDMGLTSTALVDAVQPLQSPGFDAQFEVTHRLDEGIWRLYTRPLDELQLPDLSNVVKPSGKDVEQYLEDLYRNLPEEPIPYYVGPLSGSVAERLQSYFPSGDKVRKLGPVPVPGVSTLYGHVGEEASGTAFHCEDANLRSYNCTLVGWKIWILIKPHHTSNFEDLVRRLTNCDDRCDQFVRHASVVIPPSILRAENIEFDIISSGPGEMVLTQPRQYHAVINRTASFAIATNFVLPNEDPIPKRLSLCSDDGLYHLEHQMIRKLRKRKEHDSQLDAPLRRKKPRLHELLEISVAEAPSKMPVVEVLVSETTSRDAILRFMAVVCAWREVGSDVRGQLLQVEQCNDRPKALDTLRMAFRENSQLFSFLEVLASVYLVRNLERRITNVSSKAIKRLMELRGLPHTEQSRRSICNELAAYRKWDQLCGATSAYTYEGILCFVPPVFKDYREVTRKQVHHLSRDDIVLFRSKLQGVEHVQRLCEVGRAFQMGVFGSAEFTERPFEARQGNLSELDLEDLLQLL